MSKKKLPKRRLHDDGIPVKVPIPPAIMALRKDEDRWKQEVRLWWYGDGKPSYATRYADWKVIKIDEGHVFMVWEGHGE